MTEFSRHGEWLSLIDVSGPFLAEPVLKQVFPQGLEQTEPLTRKHVRQAYDEWREVVDSDDPQSAAIHDAWIDLVLKKALELDEDDEGDVLKPESALPDSLSVLFPEHDVTLRPDFAVVDAHNDNQPLMFVAVYAPDTELSAPVKGGKWAASPAERMVELCRALNVRLGLVTNGERWMLVDGPIGGVTSFASWYARLWTQEPITLQAFVNLLGIRRFFVDDSERLPALLDESLKLQDEVTDALGEQVRRAVEVLVQALDRADVDRNRELLAGVEPPELYEAALTVLMRIVFLLSAEERGLLLLDDEKYQEYYAVSTLRMQLRAESEEILERRQDAWSRLLAIFRAVFGGIEHKALKLPALGGSLFDPDRFPFLEGRARRTSWNDHPAAPLPIDNRTVLLLLDAVQLFEGRTLSYRALDIEQIGYVYEGLLERTVVRADEVTLDLDATKNAKTPWVTLGELETAAAKGGDAVRALLQDRTGSSASRVKNDLAKQVDAVAAERLLTACHADQDLQNRIKPYLNFLRMDRWGYPLVYPEGTFMVTAGADRRETGTHYTPKSLTEAIVKETLAPLVYVGPAEGRPREDWTLKSPSELLDLKVCDPAMGSGAFLVQVCRWLSERLVEAWSEVEAAGAAITGEGEVVDEIGGLEPLRADVEDRVLTARRLIAERCLYGVDMNPLAVELAKLSIWLITLAKGRPFGFLDHNLRYGDSLLGIHDLDQLLYLDMAPAKGSSKKLFAAKIDVAVERALELRAELRARPIRDIRDVEFMASLDARARRELEVPHLIADAFIGEVLTNGADADTIALSIEAGASLQGDASKIDVLKHRACDTLGNEQSTTRSMRRPLHWPLDFPEVFDRENPGFDAIAGNPPFLGNRLWKSMIHELMQWQAQMILGRSPGKIDLSVVFHRRATDLLRQGGVYGLLATTNIAEGSSIPIGLGQISKQGSFIFAIKTFKWPGKASVTASVVGFFKGEFKGAKTSDGIDCERIGPRLEPEIADGWEPVPVPASIFCFEGVHNGKGLASVLERGNPWLERLLAEPNSLIRPYISGNDITNHALHDVDRWALDIMDRSLDEIKEGWPIAYEFLIEVVKPTRTKEALKSYKGLYERWWQFWNHRADLVRRLRKHRECIVFSKITKHPICMISDTEWIYTNKVLLIGCERKDAFAICLSSFFTEWVVARQGAKFGVGATLSLSIREAFETFPLPDHVLSDEGISAAREFGETARAWCLAANKGLTDFANALGDANCTDSEFEHARTLLNAIDQFVAGAFGFDGVLDARGYYQAPYIASVNSNAYVVPPDSRASILGHLLAMNRELYEKGDTASHRLEVIGGAA